MESKLDIVFGRSEGSHDDDWTQGYQGNFYGAEIFANGETYAATWKFDGQEESIKIGEFPSSRSTGNFYVTYEKTPRGSYVTTMRLLRKLVAGDEGKKVEFFTISDYIGNERQDFSATISITSEFCVIVNNIFFLLPVNHLKINKTIHF